MVWNCPPLLLNPVIKWPLWSCIAGKAQDSNSVGVEGINTSMTEFDLLLLSAKFCVSEEVMCVFFQNGTLGCLRRVNYGEGLRDGESVSEKGYLSTGASQRGVGEFL